MQVPSNKELRKFIGERFDDKELVTFCFDYFLEVYNDFPDGMPKHKKVMELIGYCRRRDIMKNLLVSLQQEREPQYQQTFAPGEGQKPIAPPTVHTPQARNPNQIFVSHSSQDKDLAQQVAADLKTNGYDIFITPNSIKPGEKWVPAIGRGMEESGIFLVLLTHNAVQSSWVNDETNMAIALAHENEMRVFFLDVENCRPPIMWRQRQFLPFRSKDYKQNLANLLQALGSGTPARQSVAKPRKPAVPMLEPLGEGSRLGRYEIISRLAEGKESIVYLGHNAVQKTRQLAIKVLQDQFLDNEAVVAQFLREAKMMDTVSHHANIVQMRGLEQDGKRFFFAMHYMTDGALQDRLQEGSLSLTEALPIIKRIAAALDFIHEKGIVHRELIPESILFNRKNAFLSDFSNARSPDFEETNPPETAPQYMSPEQIERADDLDHRSDIYSLGIILYEMLAGHCPFDGNNERVIHGAHLYKPVPNILASVPQLPVGVADVVRKALAKERNERYESALALYKALEAAARTSPDPAYMWQRQQKQAAQHESDGEYAQAAEIWKELNELEKAVALYETSELWDEAAQLWTQLKQLAKAALAWEQQAKTLTDSGADDQEINNVWQQAIQAHSAADNDARAAEIWQTLGEIEKAAELYKRANKTEQAADLYEKGQSWVQAAELWRQLKRHDKEAENLEKQANKVDKGPANKQKKQEAWRASAQAYEKANQPLKAAEIWHEKVGDTTKAAVVCQTAGKPEEAAELYEAIKEWAVAASLWGQLEKFRRQALALQEHALTVAASNGDAKDKELAWTVAAEVFDKTGDTKASELCKQEAARHRPQDDLTQISGIGGRTARILNQAGIYTFVQLANTSAADVQEILRKATDKRTRIRFQASWLEQAQKLAGLESQPGLEQKNNQRKLSQQRETSSKRQEKPRIEESLSAPTPKQLRDFINSYFDESELIAFCFDYFPEMYDGFSGKMSKTTKIMTLIEYCRQRNLMEDLLVSLQQERETQYQQTFAPRERQKPISPSPEPESTAKKCAATTKSGSRCRNWALDNSEYCGVHIKKLGISGDDTFIHEKTGLEFVRIPAGKFKYGGDGDKEGEKRIIDLPEYWISKTPVTNAIYKKFIDANPEYRLPKTLLGGFANWDKRKRTYPPKQSQHPVTLVSWSDAVAFCKWADLSLPTEEQWEKAARGRDGRKYPWGNDHPTDKLCNFNRNVDQTTPVGDYSPQGDSPYGCVDMGSNVREWCLNKYDTPEDISVSEGKASWTDAARVSRGGSWYNGSDNVRAAYRDRCAPDDRFNGIGFRVVAAHRSSFH